MVTESLEKFPTFIQPRGFLLFSQKLTIGTYSEQDDSTLHPYTTLILSVLNLLHILVLNIF